MKSQRFFQFLLILGTAPCLFGVLLYWKREMVPAASIGPNVAGLLAQNTYMGPIRPIPGNPQLVQIEVIVHDSPKLGGLQIQSVSFNREDVPLKPRDIYGFRASVGFQFPPGKYLLRWTVQRDKTLWPRTVTHEEEVTIDPRDSWVQISIEGETATIL